MYLYPEQLQPPQEPWLRLVTMSDTKDERSGGGCRVRVAALPSQHLLPYRGLRMSAPRVRGDYSPTGDYGYKAAPPAG